MLFRVYKFVTFAKIHFNLIRAKKDRHSDSDEDFFSSFFFLSKSMLMKAELIIPVGMAIIAMPIKLIMLLRSLPNAVMG